MWHRGPRCIRAVECEKDGLVHGFDSTRTRATVAGSGTPRRSCSPPPRAALWTAHWSYRPFGSNACSALNPFGITTQRHDAPRQTNSHRGGSGSARPTHTYPLATAVPHHQSAQPWEHLDHIRDRHLHRAHSPPSRRHGHHVGPIPPASHTRRAQPPPPAHRDRQPETPHNAPTSSPCPRATAIPAPGSGTSSAVNDNANDRGNRRIPMMRTHPPVTPINDVRHERTACPVTTRPASAAPIRTA